MTRIFWSVLGLFFVALGILGAFLPLLPTVVFLLAGAFCFARGSQRLHTWLITHPHFGPPIEDWRRYGAIRRPAKWMAMVAIVLSFVLAFALGFSTAVLAVQAAVLGAVSLFILTRPEGGAEPPG